MYGLALFTTAALLWAGATGVYAQTDEGVIEERVEASEDVSDARAEAAEEERVEAREEANQILREGEEDAPDEID